MRLGKRLSTGLRIELSRRRNDESPSPSRVQSTKRLRNDSPTQPPEAVVEHQHVAVDPPSPDVNDLPPLPLTVVSAEPTAPAPIRVSNFARSGCLSPTDSAPLLQKSLALVLSRDREKALSESEEVQAPVPSDIQLSDQKDRIGHFLLLSKLDSQGNSYHALHIKTQKLFTCQVLTSKQLGHLLVIRQRLNSAGSGMEEMILPSQSEVVCEKGKNFLFSPRSFGSLHSYVQTRKKLSEEEGKELFGQIVGMVKLCHSLGIVVRDLKLRQFVFADAGQTRLRMGWIGDVVVLEDPSKDGLSDRHGCPAYVSPEILDLSQTTHSGKAADVWSLGVLLFVILLGRYPFYDQTPARLFSKIRSGQFCIPKEEGLSLQAALLIRGLLCRDPKGRPSAQLLSAVPWLNQPSSNNVNHHVTSNNIVEVNDDHVVPSI